MAKAKEKGKAGLKKVPPPLAKSREPEYMVQVNDPGSLRRDLLESLREIILFMQGYEKFRKIQEEKVSTFTTLKEDVRGLNYLIDTKLRRYLPKGKLQAISKTEREQAPEKVEVVEEESKPKPKAVREVQPAEKTPASELEELEDQLKRIEKQLQGIKE